MHEPDPSSLEIEQFSQLIGAKEWKEMRRDLDKWSSTRKSALFEGKGSPMEATNWDNMMVTYFTDNIITNSILQSKLATQTFRGLASNWWRAHQQLVPEMVVLYEQLLEWIRTELVPLADPGAATLSWRQLRFLGDVEDYLKQLDQLTTHFPLPHATLLVMATEPLGREAVSAAYKADQMYGNDGMPYVRLRRFIEAHLQQLTPTQRKQLADSPPLAKGYGKSAEKEKRANNNYRPANTAPRRPNNFTQTNAFEVNESRGGNQESQSQNRKPNQIKKKIGKGQNPCWVCGSDQHIWFNCEKRKKGKCSVCGSMAHLTRECAQRYFPAPNTNPTRNNRQVLKVHKENLEESAVEGKTEPNQTNRESRAKQKPCNKKQSKGSTQTCTRNIEADGLLEECSLPTSLGLTPATVASKAMIEWPNVWGELSSKYPIGSLFQLSPLAHPPQASLLYYQIEANKTPIVAMLDTGASHTFITYELADQIQAELKPLDNAITTTDFGGQKSSTQHMAHISFRLASVSKICCCYVTHEAPAPVVLGLDIVLSWPLFLNPVDRCVYVPFNAQKGQIASVTCCDRARRTSPDDIQDDIAVFTVTEWEEKGNNDSFLYDDNIPELSYNPKSMAVEMVTRFSITASGFAEAEELNNFVQSLPSDFREIVNEFVQMFQPPDRDPPSRSVKHYICVPPDVVPAARRAYPLPQHKLSAMREQMHELIEKGWVQASASPWAAPVLFVPKDDGKKQRMCIDFRDLNALTKKDRFPLLRIDLLLHRSAKASIFSKIDLASGFHQIEVFTEHRELTSFILPETVDGQSLWEWKVMPFGLVNAPSTFQRAMSVALRGCEEFSVVYIDDILVFSETREQHLLHLKRVFAALQEQSYHVRLAKCLFFAPEVPFLGHILSADGIKAADKRFGHIQSFPTPFSTPKQVRSFLGMVMWYRTFIPHVATLAALLFPLTSAKKSFQWTEEAEQSVKALKQALMQTPVLSRYNHDLETRVTTDASQTGVGAVLEQKHDEVWKPVAFWSRKLIDAETRYSATDLEWLAVVEAVARVWRHLLEDIPFVVRSDHAALARKLSKSAHEPPITPRQARWIEKLMPYSITFEYIPASQNVVSDALSRYPALSTNSISLVAPQLVGLVARIALAAKLDEHYTALLEKIQHSPRERTVDSSCIDTHSMGEDVDVDHVDDLTLWKIYDGVIFHKDGRILVPKDDELRTLVISEAHDIPLGGHFDQTKTIEKVKRLWMWKGLHQDVKDYVASCHFANT